MRSKANNKVAIVQPTAARLNAELIDLGKKKQWKNLLKLVAQEEKSFNNVNYATAMSQLGRITSLDRSDHHFLTFLASLAKKIEECGLPWMGAQAVANIVHAIGKMQLKNQSTKKILVQIEQHSGWLVTNGNAQSVANTAWACATIKIEAPQLFAKIEQHSDWLVTNGNAQDIANTAWAFATVKIEAPQLFAKIEQHSDWLVTNGNAQNVANTAWACATIKIEAPQLFAKIEQHSDWLVTNGNAQDIANTAWAFATVKIEAPQLFAKIEQHSDWLVNDGDAQNVAMTAWACATLKIEAPQLFAKIEQHSDWLVTTGNAQSVANTAWACATLKIEAPQLFAKIEQHSDWLVTNGNAQDIANTAWACATLKIEAPQLFAKIEQHSDWLVNNATAQEVANTAWAFAILGIEAPQFFSKIDANALGVLARDINPQSVAILCYAISVAGRSKKSQELLSLLWGRAIKLFSVKAKFADEEYRQLAYAELFARGAGVKLKQCPEPMVKEMKIATQFVENTQSRCAKDVSNCLIEVGFDHELEVSPDARTISGGTLAIDFACKKRKVAIEYDGPWHFLKTIGSGELSLAHNGRTKAKRRLLQQLGWTVINIDFRDHYEAHRKSNVKQWLRTVLQEAGVVLEK